MMWNEIYGSDKLLIACSLCNVCVSGGVVHCTIDSGAKVVFPLYCDKLNFKMLTTQTNTKFCTSTVPHQ